MKESKTLITGYDCDCLPAMAFCIFQPLVRGHPLQADSYAWSHVLFKPYDNCSDTQFYIVELNHTIFP